MRPSAPQPPRSQLRTKAARALAAAVVTTAIVATATARQPLAQTMAPPNRLGATDGYQPIPPPSAGPPSAGLGLPSPDDQHRQRSDLTASRLLETARKDRSDGHPEIAQRVLEVLIARYPDSPHADTARRELYEIYAADSKITGSPKQNRTARAPAPQPIAAPVETNPTTEQARAAWRTSVVNFRRLQEDFRNGVGDRVFFSDGSTALGSRARAVITAQAAWLLARPEIEVVIEGHADDQATVADPDALSRQRAIAMRDRLIADGVEPDRLKIAVLGTRDPVAICPDAGCAAQNRRAILQLALRSPSERNLETPSGNSGTQARPDAGAVSRRR